MSTRRALLAAAGAAAALAGRHAAVAATPLPPFGPAFAPLPPPSARPLAPPQATPVLPRDAGLHARAQRKGLFFGAGLGIGPGHAEADLLARVPAECGLIAPEAATGWAQIQPRPDLYAFERADQLAGYAARHSLRLHGRALLSRPLPSWIDTTAGPGHAERLLAGHIERVARHLRRHAAHWEVLSDLVDPDAAASLRPGPFTRALGVRAIDVAFHACAAADPHALRVWSEAGLEYADAEPLRRRDSLLRLVAAARERGAPIQAIGLAGRLTGGRAPPDPASIGRFCDSAGALGLKVMVTELEVDDRALPADRATRDAGVAAQAEALLAGLVGHPAFAGVLSAGLSDRQSRLGIELPRADGEAPRPLPLDRELRRKRLWHGLADAFDAAPGTPRL